MATILNQLTSDSSYHSKTSSSTFVLEKSQNGYYVSSYPDLTFSMHSNTDSRAIAPMILPIVELIETHVVFL